LPSGSDPFLPLLAEISEVRDLTPDIKLFKLNLREGRIDYRPGQFAIISAFGVGEAPFTFASLPEEGLEFAIRKMGTVTSALHDLGPGDLVGIRGPYGNAFPLEEYKGKDIIIIGGGIGIAPLRPLIHWFIKRKGDYGDLLIIYGARTPRDFAFSHEFEDWARGARLELAIDPPGAPGVEGEGGPGARGREGAQAIPEGLDRDHLRPPDNDPLRHTWSSRRWASRRAR
jgi:sulfhydrogenase subunit gamma (sulfur reductase)